MSISMEIMGARLISPDENTDRLRQASEFIRNNKISLETTHLYAVLPGFCDVHVHLRQPGFCYKETIKTGTAAALHGGFTDVCSMPNLNPVPHSVPAILEQIKIIENDAAVRVHPYGAITVNQMGETLSDMEGLSNYAVAFSDDGRGVQSESMMAAAMKRAKALDMIIAAHCEDNSLLNGGYINQGVYALSHGHKGISNQSEWRPIQRDIALAKEIGVKYHICHVSTKQSVEIIRKAKAQGIDVTCETAPHYLVLTDGDLKEDGRFKMNPPLRSIEDKNALITALKDGTIDMIATDHAPHSFEEKNGGLEKSLMGVVGLETAFPIIYTHLVRTGIITLEKAVFLLSESPRKRFGLPENSGEFSLWDLDECYKINPDDFKSMGKSSPFTGTEVYGKHIATRIIK